MGKSPQGNVTKTSTTPTNKTLHQQLLDFIIHLRLHFNLILVPLYLFGVLVSGGSLASTSFWIQFFIIHVCLYGGANSLNSFYDRDEGPIGGLLTPPPIDDSVFYLSWTVQLGGLYLASNFLDQSVKASFIGWYIAGVILSVCYSHPSIRIKGNPYGSAAMVSFMQGFGAYCAGWIAGGVPVSQMMSLKGFLGAVAIQFTILGMYPLTQVYQLETDKKKGDVTLAVKLGVTMSFQFCTVIIAFAGLLLCTLLAKYYAWWKAIAVCGYYMGLLYWIRKWSKKFKSQDVTANYTTLMRITFVNSICFLGFTVSQLLDIL